MAYERGCLGHSGHSHTPAHQRSIAAAGAAASPEAVDHSQPFWMRAIRMCRRVGLKMFAMRKLYIRKKGLISALDYNRGDIETAQARLSTAKAQSSDGAKRDEETRGRGPGFEGDGASPAVGRLHAARSGKKRARSKNGDGSCEDANASTSVRS